jgi:hypothetical protein
MQEQQNIGNVENRQSTTTKPEITIEAMLNAIGDSLSELASSEDEEDGEDNDDDEEDTVHGKLSEDDEPGWGMGTISKTLPNRMERVQQTQMRLDELTQRGWEDGAHYFHERDMKSGMTELKVPAIGKPQTHLTAATPSPTTFGELKQALEIVPGQSQMPQLMSRQASSQMRLGAENPQAHSHTVPPMPAAVPHWSHIEIGKPVQPVSVYRCK